MSAFLKVREEIKHRVTNPAHLRLCALSFGAFESDSVYERVYIQLSMNVWNPVARVIRQIDIDRHLQMDLDRYENIQQ